MTRGWVVAASAAFALGACGGDDGSTSSSTSAEVGPVTGADSSESSTSTTDSTPTSSSEASTGTVTGTTGSSSGATETEGATTTGPGPLSFVAVTFNTGTTLDLDHDGDGDAYGSNEADISDQYYGDGLAWQEAIDGTQAFFADLQPDVVTFQEMFYSGDCEQIPDDKKAGFVCETWQPGDPTVAQVVLGDGYQIACHLGKNDKCAAVKKSFGSFMGCTEDLCLDGLDGAQVNGCGGGSRVGRGLIELAQGGTITLASYHGTSGLLPDDWNCRIAQIDQIFVDLDGEPAANGDPNLVMGDLNTDPYRALLDLSALRWLDFVDDGKTFEFISDAGVNAIPTYNDLFNIDHVISDKLVGSCIVPGIEGEPPVLDTVYFDHKPIVCQVTEE